MREALTIELDGRCLHGTVHGGPSSSKRGVLFFNSGTLPRSGRGDLNVRLADAFALQGYPSFRFDLPGLGDSAGELPPYHLAFNLFVMEGGYGDCAAKLTRRLLEAHRLKDMVLIGLCGGALTSVFAASLLARTEIAGLVPLDLPFNLYRGPAVVRAEDNDKKSLRPRERRLALLWKAKTRDWVLRQSWAPRVRTIYHRARSILRPVNSKELPGDTNMVLLKAVSGLLSQRTPILLFSGRPSPLQPPGFNYIEYLRRISGGPLEYVEMSIITHSFVENNIPATIEETVLKWLSGEVIERAHCSSPGSKSLREATIN